MHSESGTHPVHGDQGVGPRLPDELGQLLLPSLRGRQLARLIAVLVRLFRGAQPSSRGQLQLCVHFAEAQAGVDPEEPLVVSTRVCIGTGSHAVESGLNKLRPCDQQRLHALQAEVRNTQQVQLQAHLMDAAPGSAPPSAAALAARWRWGPLSPPRPAPASGC